MSGMDTESQMNTEGQEPGTNAKEYLTFILAGEEYAVDILRVQEIRGWEKPTKVPNSLPCMRGVINLRGTIVPIIDLRHRFGLELVEYERTTVVVVLRVEEGDTSRTMGVIVDAVSDVYRFDARSLQPAPGFGKDLDAGFARGLASIRGRLITILDVDKTLSALTLARETQSERWKETELDDWLG